MKRWALGCGLLLESTLLFAESASSGDMQSSALSQGLMLAAFIGIFYFFILRPQTKRAKAQRDLIAQLTVGDEVVTAGGIVGKVHRVADNFFVLAIADNVEVVIQKQAVAGVLPKGSLNKI